MVDFNLLARSGSDRDLTSKAKEVTHRLTSGAPLRKQSVPSQGTDKQISVNSSSDVQGTYRKNFHTL